LNAVFNACLIGGQCCAMGAHFAQKPGSLIRNPNFGKKGMSKQPREHSGFDLGLGFCFRNHNFPRFTLATLAT
jgi:hypothetical protein